MSNGRPCCGHFAESRYTVHPIIYLSVVVPIQLKVVVSMETSLSQSACTYVKCPGHVVAVPVVSPVKLCSRCQSQLSISVVLHGWVGQGGCISCCHIGYKSVHSAVHSICLSKHVSCVAVNSVIYLFLPSLSNNTGHTQTSPLSFLLVHIKFPYTSLCIHSFTSTSFSLSVILFTRSLLSVFPHFSLIHFNFVSPEHYRIHN